MTTTRINLNAPDNRELQDRYSAREVIKVAIASFCTGLIAFGIAALAITATYTDTPNKLTLPACATEDSYNCFWDAEKHGNGEGRSFITIGDEDSYQVFLQN